MPQSLPSPVRGLAFWQLTSAMASLLSHTDSHPPKGDPPQQTSQAIQPSNSLTWQQEELQASHVSKVGSIFSFFHPLHIQSSYCAFLLWSRLEVIDKMHSTSGSAKSQRGVRQSAVKWKQTTRPATLLSSIRHPACLPPAPAIKSHVLVQRLPLQTAYA